MFCVQMDRRGDYIEATVTHVERKDDDCDDVGDDVMMVLMTLIVMAVMRINVCIELV